MLPQKKKATYKILESKRARKSPWTRRWAAPHHNAKGNKATNRKLTEGSAKMKDPRCGSGGTNAAEKSSEKYNGGGG